MQTAEKAESNEFFHKLGGHFLETELHSGTVLWGRWWANLHCVTYDVITKHKGGEDDEIEIILSMQNLHPKLVMFNNKDLQSWCTASLDNPWTVGTYSYIQTTKTHWVLTQEYKVKYLLLLHFTRKAL